MILIELNPAIASTGMAAVGFRVHRDTGQTAVPPWLHELYFQSVVSQPDNIVSYLHILRLALLVITLSLLTSSTD